MDYLITIGLEIHAELKTNTKVFCGCKNEFGGEPNSKCCPVCIGLPGALPVLNKDAVRKCIVAGLSTNCEINDVAIFERKNYFYPDLPKAYQISQLVKPICINGYLTLKSGKVIRLNRIHLEEDAGKLIHKNGSTLVDYNRGGVPLIESVTEPDLSSADEAIEFLELLRNTYVFADVSDCKMQEGSMRCDVNLSIRKKGETKLGTRTEMKNLNSFSAVRRAIAYETDRQIDLVESGGKVSQETRRWDDNKGENFTMRTKEDAEDYRYFPDPDLVPVKIRQDYVEKIKSEMLESFAERQNKYLNKFKLSEYDVGVILSDIELSNFLEKCLKSYNNIKSLVNILMADIVVHSKNNNSKILIQSENLTSILKLYDENKINQAAMRKLIEVNFVANNEVKDILIQATQLNLIANNNEDELKAICLQIVNENPQAVLDYKSGNQKAIAFFIGQGMKKTQGKANASILSKIFNETLAKI